MTSTRAYGYAALFGTETVIAGEFRERLQRGCFAESIARDDIRALLDHDPGRVLGRTSAGTLRLEEDAIGLQFSLDLDSTTPSGQEAAGTVGRQDVSQCSFGFSVTSEEWRDDGQALPLRIITGVRLFEISLVAWPAYDQTSVKLATGKTLHNRTNAFRRKAEAAMRQRGIL
jgi:HK97 family phage prohead protease